MARQGADGVRWHRCLRCDSWLPLAGPEHPSRRVPPDRDEVELPLRGKALRDKVVLRLIAIDRALHAVVLTVIAVAIFVFAANQTQLRAPAYRILTDLQGGLGGPTHDPGHGLLHELRRLFSVRHGTLMKIGVVVAVYAVLEGAEAVGLWLGRRWAEYLTFVATTLLLPLELYELTHKLSPLKVVTLVLNVAVAVWLLRAKRLFGLRGGARAEREERERDMGWPAIERTTPGACRSRVSRPPARLRGAPRAGGARAPGTPAPGRRPRGRPGPRASR